MKNKITLLLFLVLTTYTGCKKDFLESTDPNKLTTDKFYKTPQDAIQATNSVYSALNIYMSKADMFNAIVRERALEFPLEQIRGKDIRRWGIAGPILRAQGKQHRGGVHELLPIPQKEIDANAAIGPEHQNPGY